jgi:4-amino-4-deoxy-L-arabinose transferase-like glycosyltransferase
LSHTLLTRPPAALPFARSWSRPSLPLLGLLLLCGLLFFQGLDARELTASHEARAGQNALSILAEGCWGLPHLLDGTVEMQKPPLYYWLVACVGWLRGEVDAWAIRLPAALAALGTVLTVFAFGAAVGRRTAGLIAAAALASMMHFTHLAQVGRIDMPLCLCATLSLTGYYLAQKRPDAAGRWYLLVYVAFAAGLLLKGPIALVLPGCVIVTHRIWGLGFQPDILKSGYKPNLRSLVWGIPLLLALAAPWYLYAGIRTGGDFFRVFFWYHNFQRGFGSEGALATHPWWFYGPRLAVDLLPWGLAVPPLVWYAWRKGILRTDSEARFGLIWLLAMALLLSLMRFKRADYLLPAYPGAALFLGCVAERCFKVHGEPRSWRIGFVALLTVIAVAWQVYRAIPANAVGERHHRIFAEELRRRVPPAVPVIFFRVEAHPLAFHFGRRYNTVLEWENLDTWAGSGKNYFVVLPPECERELPDRVRRGRLERLLDSGELFPGERPPDRPLVLLRNARPDPENLHDRPPR